MKPALEGLSHQAQSKRRASADLAIAELHPAEGTFHHILREAVLGKMPELVHHEGLEVLRLFRKDAPDPN